MQSVSTLVVVQEEETMSEDERRETGLNTAIGVGNKGFAMLKKMGLNEGTLFAQAYQIVIRTLGYPCVCFVEQFLIKIEFRFTLNHFAA